MPALSQSLVFTVNNTSTVSVNYPNTGTSALTYVSNKVKGDGFYGNSDGMHSVQFAVNGFIGKIELQSSLSLDPTEADWFTVELGSNNLSIDTTGLITQQNITYVQYSTATTLTRSYNFIGNFVWVRGKISQFEQGSVNYIRYNH